MIPSQQVAYQLMLDDKEAIIYSKTMRSKKSLTFLLPLQELIQRNVEGHTLSDLGI